ncbi:MAG TPA: CDF family Co(II)/Ni(II) efflux transporter DmeF [Xanthobacteraceae bacterium]
MHHDSIEAWQHGHVFLGEKHEHNERRTRLVVALAAAMMVAEIVGGTIFGSMALLADGWHMATHVAALAIAMFAYRYARRHAHDGRFSFGTGKVGELAGFASAVILAVVALLIAYESLARLATPKPIDFDEATAVAAIGLVVNLVSAWLLFDEEHHRAHAEGHAHRHDSNAHSAYLHVLADAATSVAAIAALLAGRALGWIWLDPVVGIAGALVIAWWSWGLMRAAGAVLLDLVPSQWLAQAVRERLEVDGDRVADLHLWRLGPGHIALSVAIVADRPQPPGTYKQRLVPIQNLSHVTVEGHACPGHGARG